MSLNPPLPRDPQHYAMGAPVPGEERSYGEQNANGVVCRHASWFLGGSRH